MRILKEVTSRPDHVGYYSIPGFGNYVLSKKCKVINLSRPGKILLGYKKVKGYVSFTLVNDFGDRCSIGAHKLLALTFLECPGHIDDYVPNHIDEDPTNNVLENIEWLTTLENVRWSAHKTRKPIPIDVRSMDSDVVLHFDTIAHAARHFGIHVSTIRQRCELGRRRVYDMCQFKYGHMDWVTPDLDSGTEKRVLLKNYVSGSILLFQSQRDCAEYLNVSESILSEHINQQSDRLFPGQYIPRRFTKLPQWPTIDHSELEYMKCGIKKVPGKTRGIMVTDAATGIYSYFETATAAALAHGILPTTLNWRLKKPTGTVHSDGKMYAYI